MQPFSVVGLFCEDIREEKAGTDTLIGILPDNVNVAEVPALLPRLAIYVRISIDPSIDLGPISLRLILVDQSQRLLTTIEPEIVSPRERTHKLRALRS